MSQIIKKSSLWGIYLGTAVILLIPLLVDNRFFFPFISTKVFLFRIVVEALVLLYLVLNWASDEYRPRVNWLTGFAAVFILIATISSFFGPDFYRSFWGDIERGDGVLLWLHLLAFLVVLTGAIRSSREWAVFLDISLGVAVLMSAFAIGQAMQSQALLATSGERVDAALGNPAFFATYLLFHIVFAASQFFVRIHLAARWYYGSLIALFATLIPFTQTRGAVVGLAAGVVIAAGLWIWANRSDRRARIAGGAVIIIVAGVGIGLFMFRNQPFIQESRVLRRVVSISLQERTAENRIVTWRAAMAGWKEKFWLGWGLENFDTVFNKGFPPVIYQKAGSQVWFDRAHNVIFDRGVTTGALGLTFFLLLFIYPGYHFLRLAFRDPSKRLIAVIFVSFLAAYLVQDLFIFESVTIYIIWFFALAFWSASYLPYRKFVFLDRRLGWLVAAIVYGAILGPLMWKVNIFPAKINIAAADAIRSNPQTEDFFVIVDRFKKVIEAPTYGQQEYRLQFIEFVDGQLANIGEIAPAVKPVLAYTDDAAALQIGGGKEDAKNYLLAMRHYNYTFAADPAAKYERLQKALSIFPDLVRLSPTRPQVYQEAGYSHLYLYRNAKARSEQDFAAQSLRLAEENFQKTIDLNSKVFESYHNLIMLYLNSGQSEKIQAVLDAMDQAGVAFRTDARLSDLLALSKSNFDYKWSKYFSKGLTELDDQKADAWIDLALSHAYLGEREEAISIGERIKQFGGDYVRQADLFIQNVKTGFYEQQLREALNK